MSIKTPASAESTGLVWIKSSYSGGEGGECVEVAHSPAAVHVRDSKNVRRPHLAVGRDGWARFVRYAAGS
ncbi:DUF397 domain-containing protein [Actinacidiphila oryziradicis]|uniref:DUF397 domain-containing protein n=1 Tax=Actinacidiphila oryziradicis TaxID=2571141 RepID=A0A4U0SPN5_9ACTN|nr:DUF397 domain-containing protein [Actinacidiphila oryziradicis]TKA11902.1 DUF397 domain-containing protein [Actinacidiphila oryziradicis]